MSFVYKRFLPTLAVLALAWAQVFGMQRGFECDHHGMVLTEAEHCHRAELDDHTDYVPCEGSAKKDCGDKEDSEHHLPVVEDLQARPPTSLSLAIPAFIAVLVATQLDEDGLKCPVSVAHSLMQIPLDTGGESPPAALQVVRCMVMLV